MFLIKCFSLEKRNFYFIHMQFLIKKQVIKNKRRKRSKVFEMKAVFCQKKKSRIQSIKLIARIKVFVNYKSRKSFSWSSPLSNRTGTDRLFHAWLLSMIYRSILYFWCMSSNSKFTLKFVTQLDQKSS